MSCHIFNMLHAATSKWPMKKDATSMFFLFYFVAIFYGSSSARQVLKCWLSNATSNMKQKNHTLAQVFKYEIRNYGLSLSLRKKGKKVGIAIKLTYKFCHFFTFLVSSFNTIYPDDDDSDLSCSVWGYGRLFLPKKPWEAKEMIPTKKGRYAASFNLYFISFKKLWLWCLGPQERN